MSSGVMNTESRDQAIEAVAVVAEAALILHTGARRALEMLEGQSQTAAVVDARLMLARALDRADEIVGAL